jgi:hypothetical protein
VHDVIVSEARWYGTKAEQMGVGDEKAVWRDESTRLEKIGEASVTNMSEFEDDGESGKKADGSCARDVLSSCNVGDSGTRSGCGYRGSSAGPGELLSGSLSSAPELSLSPSNICAAATGCGAASSSAASFTGPSESASPAAVKKFWSKSPVDELWLSESRVEEKELTLAGVKEGKWEPAGYERAIGKRDGGGECSREDEEEPSRSGSEQAEPSESRRLAWEAAGRRGRG